jgi:hypothetical protein
MARLEPGIHWFLLFLLEGIHVSKLARSKEERDGAFDECCKQASTLENEAEGAVEVRRRMGALAIFSWASFSDKEFRGRVNGPIQVSIQGAVSHEGSLPRVVA